MIKYTAVPKSLKDEKPKPVKRPASKKDVVRVVRDMQPGTSGRGYQTRG